MNKELSIILTINHSIVWLDKVLYAYNAQTYMNFEMIVIDDEFSVKTQERIDSISRELFYTVNYISKKDFNIDLVITDYILLANESSLPQDNFIEEHIKYREEGKLLSIDPFGISESVANTITQKSIYEGICFSNKWLKENGLSALYGFFNSKKSIISFWKDEITLPNYDSKSLLENLSELNIKVKDLKTKTACLYLESATLQNKPAISVIVSTYNSPEWLKKVLWSYECQTFKNFELIIADDGSSQETIDFINSYKQESSLSIQHVWHEDNGFQKTIILNKAILASKSNYLLFTDGDCVARKDFLEVHINNREEGYFLSGGYFKLPMNISKSISKEDILSQKCFDIKWLKENGLNQSIKNLKLTSESFTSDILNFITPTVASWNGHNSSGWKEDILKVNGFDERMQYGGEDRELGERMFNLKIKSKQLRYSAICVHLDHKRGYVKPEMIEKNKKIRATTKDQNITRTDYGIEK